METNKHDGHVLDALSKEDLIGYATLCGFVLSLQQFQARETALRLLGASDASAPRVLWKYDDLGALWRLAVQYRYRGEDFLELDDMARATIRSSSIGTLTAFKTALRKVLATASEATNPPGRASLSSAFAPDGESIKPQREPQNQAETTITVSDGNSRQVLDFAAVRAWNRREAANESKLTIRAAARSRGAEREHEAAAERLDLAWTQGGARMTLRDDGDVLVVTCDDNELLTAATRLAWLNKIFTLTSGPDATLKRVLDLDRRRAFILLQRAESQRTTGEEGVPCLLA